MKRIRLELTPDLEVEFTDRGRALRQVEEWAEKSTWWPVVIFGPEGCGKTAFLRQASAMLKEAGFNVLYLHPLDRVFNAEVDDQDVKTAFLNLVKQSLEDERWGRVVFAVFDLARKLLEKRRRKVAVVADDVFQAIGLDKAATYVKGLLNMIEHSEHKYEKIVILVATSEGVSRREIGRHRWADLTPMWNMAREGFRELYDKIPGQKPPFEEVWRWAGGNPNALRRLYEAGWNVERVVDMFVKQKRLLAFINGLSSEERKWLLDAVEDPDTLYARGRIPLMERLVELNLLVDEMYPRRQYFWIDQPPPEKDPELGIGKNAAWQTPVHREAVRRALREA
jgi:KaiC/GvpD/RAD55 family RecA-like ATPase